jgi:hypothetical protein
MKFLDLIFFEVGRSKPRCIAELEIIDGNLCGVEQHGNPVRIEIGLIAVQVSASKCPTQNTI